MSPTLRLSIVVGTLFTSLIAVVLGATEHYLPKYSTGGALVDSNIFQTAGGLVGIGMTSPDERLVVSGNARILAGDILLGSGASGSATDMRVSYGSGAEMRFVVGAGGERMRIANNGYVGIAISTPNQALHVNGNARVQAGDLYLGAGTIGTATDMRLSYGSNNSMTFINGAGGERMRITNGGDIGIGTSTPTARLHVAGDIKVDGNIAAKYQDVAEWVVSRDAAAAGSVVSVVADARNVVASANTAYDTAIAGVVSSQPGIVLGEKAANKVLVAQSGRVPVKADAAFGSIRAGDLLVASPTPGHAMRSEPLVIGGSHIHRPGTILGKALEPLAEGTGEILVLITLQ